MRATHLTICLITMLGSQSAMAAKVCEPTEVRWSGKNACVSDTIQMNEGETRILASRQSVLDGKIINRGQATVVCQAGKVLVMKSNCTGRDRTMADDPLKQLRTGAPTDPRPIVTDVENVKEAARKNAESAKDVVFLQSNIGADWKPETELIAEQAQEVAKQATGAPSFIGVGLQESLISTPLPMTVSGARIEVFAKFSHADGSRTKFVDHEVCLAGQCKVFRTAMAVAKGGGSGHYWGYEQQAVEMHTYVQGAPQGSTLTIKNKNNHLLMDQQVRVTLVP
jgi:hypothetical protein